MAVQLTFLLLLLDVFLLIHYVASLCNVTCTTDYKTSLNCSCSGSVPSFPIQLEANCRTEEQEVNGSCEVKPPQSWCVMHPQCFDCVTSVETNCTTSVHHRDGQVGMMKSESSSWILSEMVKPLQPFNVQVTTGDRFFNITWDINNHLEEPLTYNVRIRANKDLSKDPVYSLSVDQNFMLIYDEKLQPQTKYTVDVQAKMSPQAIYEGPWSEWSSPAELETSGMTEGADARWWYFSFSVIFLLGLLILGYSQKMFWLKRLRVITYIPRPNEFFKPLYSAHEGKFEDWVRPVFSEYDILMINTPVEVMSKKKQDALYWSTEKQSYGGDDDAKEDGCFLHSLQPHGDSLLQCQDCSSLHGTGHSTGHISIHTVTLSGEEESEEENVSRRSINSIRSYQDGSFEEENREHAGYDLEESQVSRLHRQNRILPDMNFPQQAQFIEEERVSLDSFVSNEQSEDGYPRMDLDTIDSGFGEPECRSPAASESSMAEQTNSDLFHENSNYVKQWMISSTLQEDSLASNKPSEDGCPHVDLDTVDSGFGEPECRSPTASESSIAEQTNSDLFHKNSNSIYVKQWMICSTLQEDSNNSTDELPKTL
ncbi:hypothetical protein LDENG_00022040 [Lucifuga dentata]|nr:hypothetical protein LDENG_00022040 [Lucifuga dentata]